MFLSPNLFYFEILSNPEFKRRVSNIEDTEITMLQSGNSRNEIYEIKSGKDSMILKQPIAYSNFIYFGFNREVAFLESFYTGGELHISKQNRYILMPKGNDLDYFVLSELMFNGDFEEGSTLFFNSLGQAINEFYTEAKKYKGISGIPEYLLLIGRVKNFYAFGNMNMLFEGRKIESSQMYAVKSFLNNLKVKNFLLGEEEYSLNQTVIHGDMHIRNILFKNPNCPEIDYYIIDFENIAIGDSFYDAVVLLDSLFARMEGRISSNQAKRLEQVKRFKTKVFKIFGLESKEHFAKYLFLLILHRLNKLTIVDCSNFEDRLKAMSRLIEMKDENFIDNTEFLNFLPNYVKY